MYRCIGSGAFFAPTLIVDATHEMDISQAELFAPILVVYRFDSEEAVRLANNTEYGLASYVYTQDKARMARVSERLETGIVAVNTTAYSHPDIPFGGMKQSGVGREGGVYGVEEFLEKKAVCTKSMCLS